MTAKNETEREAGEVKTLAQRMHAVMQDVKYVQKGEKPVDGKYRAVTHDAVIKVVRPALVEHGILYFMTVDSHEIVGEWTTKNDRGWETRWTNTCVDGTVTYMNVDDPSDRIDLKYFAYGIDNQDKGPGKAISYLKKYGLLVPLGLETGDDPDNDQGDDHNQRPKEAPSKPKAKPAAKPEAPQGGDDSVNATLQQVADLLAEGEALCGLSQKEILQTATANPEKGWDGWTSLKGIANCKNPQGAAKGTLKSVQEYVQTLGDAEAAQDNFPGLDDGLVDEDGMPF